VPFYRFEKLPQETISPHYSTAAGGTVTGEIIEVGKYAMAKGTGADPHRDPNEQIVYVLRGKLRVRVEQEERILEPGDVVHFPADAVHEVRALEDSEFLSSKNLVDGKGSKGWSAAAPVRDRRQR